MMTVGALCSGYGGLELALMALGLEPALAWYAENDDSPATVMDAHWPAARNLGDLTEITDPPAADVVTAGFPCQPVSVAGQRQGVDDDRWLVDDVCRVARLAGARTLILENVAGILTANDGDALARVCEALAREGFSRWEWCTLRASDVGAPHRRKRWFCVAHTDGERRSGPGRPAGRMGPIDRSAVSDRSVAHTDGPTIRPQPISITRCSRPAEPGPDRQAAPDPDRDRLQRLGIDAGQDGHPLAGSHLDRRDRARFGGYAEAVTRWETTIGRPAPDPTIDGRLSHLFVEWMMGLPAGWVTDHLNRRPALRVLGNGVVPQQAAAAIQLLEAAA